jgi:lysine 6-dehydrogenase
LILQNNAEKEKKMSIHYTIIGAGRQGTSSAYDLAIHGKASRITMVDVDKKAATSAAKRINQLVGQKIAESLQVDIRNQKALQNLLEKTDAFISAVPYYFNLELTKAAIKTKTHLTDMGGNEKVVAEQLQFNEEALKAGISVIPDCGMGPGMTGSLAAYGINQMDEAQDVFIWDGGLPLNPQPPWNFQLTFHVNGLTNEYFGEATFLREGRVIKLPTFTEYELVDFPPLGQLEAFVTSGGTSTAIKAYQDKLRTYQNKTLRYPGHFEQFLGFKTLGLYELEPVSLQGRDIVPRNFFHALLEPKIKASPDYRDICLIRVIVQGIKDGKRQKFLAEIVDKYDEKTGFTSMERVTGWHASIMLEMAVQGRAAKGVHGLEKAVDPEEFMAKVKKRGFKLTERFLPWLDNE